VHVLGAYGRKRVRSVVVAPDAELRELDAGEAFRPGRLEIAEQQHNGRRQGIDELRYRGVRRSVR